MAVFRSFISQWSEFYLSKTVQLFQHENRVPREENLQMASMSSIGSSEEFDQFSNDILAIDENNAGHLVQLDLQEKNNGNTTHAAPRPVLKLKPEVGRMGTVRLFRQLFESGGTDRNDRRQFLDAVVKTRVMVYTRNFLKKTGKIQGDLNSFKETLEKLWFTEYWRSGEISSGFRHVFMGEKKGSQVNGFHNWLFFAQEQEQENIEYLGWFKHVKFNDNKGSVLNLSFKWKKLLKKMSSMFVGTSPELEMALYTACFYGAGPELNLGGARVTLKTVPQHVDSDQVIGTAYPVI